MKIGFWYLLLADGTHPAYLGEAAQRLSTEPLLADLAELRTRAADLGRENLPVTVMNAPPDATVIATLAEAGVERVLLELPRTDRDATLRTLDGHADLLT